MRDSVFSIDSIRDSISALLIGASFGFKLASDGPPMTSCGLDSQQPMVDARMMIVDSFEYAALDWVQRADFRLSR